MTIALLVLGVGACAHPDHIDVLAIPVASHPACQGSFLYPRACPADPTPAPGHGLTMTQARALLDDAPTDLVACQIGTVGGTPIPCP